MSTGSSRRKSFADKVTDKVQDYLIETKQEIDIKVSTVSYNLMPGSKDSKEFLKMIQDLDDEAFYTDFIKLIDYKWKNHSWII